MVKIKFCGIKRIEDIIICNDLMPDYIGFVFYKESKRYVSEVDAKVLKEKINNYIKVVGVFVDEDIEKISSIVSNKIIDIVQLHGSEDELYINNLRKRINVPIIKAYKIKSSFDILKANVCPADYVLLDSGSGSGEVFNWDLLKDINRDYFLAGGLNAHNVSEAIEKLKPFAVDVSSGIETNGYKDKNKMLNFIEKVR